MGPHLKPWLSTWRTSQAEESHFKVRWMTKATLSAYPSPCGKEKILNEKEASGTVWHNNVTSNQHEPFLALTESTTQRIINTQHKRLNPFFSSILPSPNQESLSTNNQPFSFPPQTLPPSASPTRTPRSIRPWGRRWWHSSRKEWPWSMSFMSSWSNASTSSTAALSPSSPCPPRPCPPAPLSRRDGGC